jgi:hypothetical protein
LAKGRGVPGGSVEVSDCAGVLAFGGPGPTAVITGSAQITQFSLTRIEPDGKGAIPDSEIGLAVVDKSATPIAYRIDINWMQPNGLSEVLDRAVGLLHCHEGDAPRIERALQIYRCCVVR